jgi:hypothetical protein
MTRMAMTVLWPSFLAAALAEGVIFSLIDPADLGHLGGAGLSPMAVYSLGFFLLWSLCALASLLTCYLVLVPAAGKPPF